MLNEQSKKQNSFCTTNLGRQIGSKLVEEVVQLSFEYLQGWQLLERGGRASLQGTFYQDFCKITQQTPSSARSAAFNSESRLTNSHGPFALEQWPSPTSQLHSFACSQLLCRGPIQNVPNGQHSLEEQPVHLAITPSTVAPVRFARLLQ